MKKQTAPDFLPEYDFSAGVRGKYVNRLAAGTNIVVLDKDVQQIFPDSIAVNAALRALGRAVEVPQGGSGAAKRPARTRTKSGKRWIVIPGKSSPYAALIPLLPTP